MAALDVERADFLREDDILIFEKSVERFLDDHAPQERVEQWRRAGIVERSMWRETGEAGLLCLAIPEEYGGANGDFSHEVVMMEQVARKEISGFAVALHNAIVAPYLLHYGSEEQKKAWLPKMASGELVGAIAMTEPGAGSDLQGIRTTARLRGQPLCHKRAEDLHQQWPACRSNHRRREDRSIQGRKRNLAYRRRDG
jgi:acyl-CoA dehydrogenase